MIKSCSNCGAQISVPKCLNKPTNFCNRKCLGEYRRGKIKTPAAERFYAKVEKSESCWIWIGAMSWNGYGRFAERKHHIVGAHQFAWKLKSGTWPDGYVLHSCDNRLCVNPDHLRIGTQQDNINDAGLRNRRSRGSTHGHAKFTERDIAEIRTSDETNIALGRRYNVIYKTIWKIRTRRSWTHVP